MSNAVIVDESKRYYWLSIDDSEIEIPVPKKEWLLKNQQNTIVLVSQNKNNTAWDARKVYN
jgi:hypothetical protein